MAQMNIINNSSPRLVVRPESAGDQWIQFSINGTGEFRIGSDATDDSFRISQGSALGTNDTLVASSAGEVTLPLQPAFHAYLASQDSNVTGDGTRYTLGTNVAFTERFDQGSDFNTNGTFTAPVTGRYSFKAQVKISGIGSNHQAGFIQFVASNRDTEAPYCNPYDLRYEGGDTFSLYDAVTVDMDAADTITLDIFVNSTDKTIDIDGSASGNETVFAGYLAV